jgi:hypothetical protein
MFVSFLDSILKFSEKIEITSARQKSPKKK